jgi:septal ring factor EnvC (AmiA/AmiB activator)
MARPIPARSKLSAEERTLQRAAEELRRKEQDLERQLRMLPAKMEARRTREKELARIQARTSSPAISLNGARGPRSLKQTGKRRPLPVRELQNARIKFLVLCLILATIVILLWRAIP